MNPAFAYIYDDFLSDRRFEREISILETELASRGVEGQVARLAMFRSARETIIDLACAGAKNIVFVGNDKTVEKMMWFLPDVGVTVGYIPLTKPAHIGTLLGIPMGLSAVDVLAARLVETIDVGKLDDRYFLTEVIVPATVASLEVEGQYRVSPAVGGAIAVRNLGSVSGKIPVAADPKDGWLEAIIQTRVNGDRWLGKSPLDETTIRLKRGTIISKEPIDVFMDGHTVNGFSFKLSIVPNKLKVITGKGRETSGRAT
ncbi:MAG: hypothetical protein Q7N87_05250 [Candidatus Uhrbacteria bacterium]|nr:hypothetical protein [Candidatus Uhrbacteria bacterium]